jgi:glucosyl-3-phosphoglycerate synthase
MSGELVLPEDARSTGCRAVHRGVGGEFGLLVDVTGLVGLDRLAQVDLGSIEQDRGTLRKLAPQAVAVLTAALRRAGLEGSRDPECWLLGFDEWHLPGVELVSVAQRPPIRTMAANHARSAEVPA